MAKSKSKSKSVRPYDVCVAVEGYEKDENFNPLSTRIGKFWPKGEGRLHGTLKFTLNVPEALQEIQIAETSKGKAIMSKRMLSVDLAVFTPEDE